MNVSEQTRVLRALYHRAAQTIYRDPKLFELLVSAIDVIEYLQSQIPKED